MRVLNLVTNQDAQFYRQQLESLARRGVQETTLPVPGQRDVSDDADSRRSRLDYVRFIPQVVRHSFGNYDLVHANYGLTAPAALAQLRLPVVLSLWGSDLLGPYGRMVRWCARRADAVIVMSEEMAAALDTDVHVIPHGVDCSLFRPMPQAPARRAIGWREDAHHVLFPYATERDVKNFPRARRVTEGANERLDADVVLQTLHDIPHARMPLYVNAADALLLTSKWEGSPNSVKEAMACDTPVVSTDVGDVGERLSGVRPGGVGETDAELVDHLVSVCRQGPPSNGREAVAPLGLERMGKRIHDLYDDVLSAH